MIIRPAASVLIATLLVFLGCRAKPWYLTRAEGDPDFRLVYELCRDEAYDAASRRPVILSKAIEECLHAKGYTRAHRERESVAR